MAVVAKGSPDYKRAPAGIHPAICIDVIDRGIEKTNFKDERTGADKYAPKVRIVWQLHIVDEDGNEVLRDDGLPFRVGKDYTLSLNQKANLRKDLENWRGKAFTDEDLAEGFDVEKLLHVQCQLNLQDVKRNDKVYTNVTAVLAKHKSDPKIPVERSFKREMDILDGKDVRSPKSGQSKPAPAQDPFDEEEDDLPF